ncbi:hypothetical protein ABEY96_28845 [Priestia aryabhattai]|uniref:hypothetical protein n=1 Tax=Priestia aryabhattai TaxID=412384 RepID=UPI003D2659E3
MENFNKDKFEKHSDNQGFINETFTSKESDKTVYAPQVSYTHKGVYEELFTLCRGDERFDGPWIEHRVSRCSLDIGIIKGLQNPVKGLHKIAYEVDGYNHSEEYDRRRDWFLFNKHNWYIFRISVDAIDLLGYKSVAQQIYNHLLYQFGFVKEKNWLPGVISTYQDWDDNKRRIH